MKLRIKGNSIRYRLSKTDIDTFGEKGSVEERTEIGMNVLVYELRKSDEVNLTAELVGGRLTVFMPSAMAKEWVDTEKVGFDARLKQSNGSELYLLMEKDFKCLDDTIEDQSDNYDNPLLSK